MSDDGWQLVMPFLPVASRGGPFPDNAYVAGYEMGGLDALLGHQATVAPLQRLLRVENQQQADLLAMKHGWRAEFTPTDTDGWLHAEFQQLPAGDTTG